MRAEKRKKNAPKELARLKTALGHEGKGEITMKDISEIATVVPVEKLKDVNKEGHGGELFSTSAGNYLANTTELQYRKQS